MLPGREYTPGDIWYLLVRHKWLIILPWLGISIGCAVVARVLPDQYRSTSLVQVVPQRVPENLVKSTVTQRIEERLPAISQQILSRTRLERIIQDFGLYAEERKTELMEDIVEEMRRGITVDMVKGDAFRIGYVSNDARTAMKVTERLASLFVEENLRDREVLAEGANQFLDSQLDDARRRLLDHEKKLEEYRRQFSGQLPTQLGGNLQSLQSMQMQLNTVSESINRDRDRRLVVERQLVDLTSDDPAAATAAGLPPVPVAAPRLDPQSAAAQAEAAKAQLADLEQRLKPEHPDVQRARRQLRDLERKAEAEAAQAPVSQVAAGPVVSPAALVAERTRQLRVRDLRAELESIDKQVAYKEDNVRRLQRQMSDTQSRVDATPTRESEMIALNRDYDTLSRVYTGLLAKSEDAKVAANLERRQIGEQFKVIDAARLPERPFSPNRPLIYGGGVAGGLVFGLAIVVLLEYRDSSFRTDEDVVKLLALPVLATIPALVTAEEMRRAFRRKVAIAVGSVCVAVGGGALLIWKTNLISRFL